jgi:hypothetical protein
MIMSKHSLVNAGMKTRQKKCSRRATNIAASLLRGFVGGSWITTVSRVNLLDKYFLLLFFIIILFGIRANFSIMFGRRNSKVESDIFGLRRFAMV